MGHSLIGLTGPAGAGKDTIASHMVMHYGYKRMAFATPIYRMLSAGLGYNINELEALKRSGHQLGNKTIRQLLQTLGTEWGRQQVHPDLWVELLDSEWNRSDHPKLVISDVRFTNEVAWVRANQGTVAAVLRPNYYWDQGHDSETGVDFDVTLRNTGTLDDIDQAVQDLLHQER